MNDPHPMFPWLTAPRRTWLYQFAAALLPLLVAVGVVTATLAPLIVAVIVAFLSAGTAALHTPKAAPAAALTAPPVEPLIPTHITTSVQCAIGNHHYDLTAGETYDLTPDARRVLIESGYAEP